jgi:mannose-1-phosphate guanylyltransferase
MRALLLAAGLGTRLRPLTDYVPKCLIPIHGRPLLDYWLELLVIHGISEILVNTHYFAELVSKYIAQSTWTENVTLVFEETLLGTGGTVLANKDFFQNGPLLVAHADNLTIFDPTAFLTAHKNRPAGTELTMMLFETPAPESCGIVELDQQGVVQVFHEKVKHPPGNLANAAVYILEPSVINFMRGFGKIEIDLSTEIVPRYQGQIATFRNNRYHRDIGTVASWIDAHKEFPPIPASALNTKAWAETLSSVDTTLQKTMAQLLAQPCSMTHEHHKPTGMIV